jgi:5-methylcytosine-specific restriction endonuclease McrA
MPILPENKKRYPENWKEISENIRFKRAGNRCENCGAVNHSYVNRQTRKICLKDEADAVRIVLTTAHPDHTPEHNEEDNLKALCQKCHNKHDIGHRKETRQAKKLKGQIRLIFEA